MRRLVLAGLLLGAAAPALGQAPAPAPAAEADVSTSIDPDVSLGKALGTTVQRDGSVYTIDGGRLAGSNLFHSFAQFDLAAGDLARWAHSAGDPASIRNVVNRVTGGNPSYLFGTLNSTALPNADFFFINPAGIVFGADSQVNVPAAAHFSTARELLFGSGPAFTVTTPGGSTLSVAVPEAFGFLGNEDAILVSGAAEDFLAQEGRLSLSAAHIRIGDSIIKSDGLQLFASGGVPAELRLGLPSPGFGSIRLSNAGLSTRAGTGGDGAITLSGGTIALDGSRLSAFSSAGADGGTILLSASSTLAVAGDSAISALGFAGTSAGDIYAFAPSIDFRNSAIESAAGGRGAPGSIALVGDRIKLSATDIVSRTVGAGEAGVVLLQGSQSVTLDGFSSVSTDSTGSGKSGAISIATGQLSITDSLLSADAFGDGDAGGVLVSADNATLLRSFVTSDSWGEGSGGSLLFSVPGTLTLRESYFSSNAQSLGGSGGILLSGGNVQLLERSGISASAFGPGDALIVGIELTGTLSVRDGSEIAADTSSGGSAGGIVVDAAAIEVDDGRIASEAFGDGDGGLVSLTASGPVTLEGGSAVASDTHGVGDAGGVVIDARDVLISGESAVSSDARGDGEGGGIAISASNAIELERGFVSADVRGAGDGGDVSLKAKSIALRSGSFVSADGAETTTGDAGDVKVQADSLDMGTFSALSSEARGQGAGGNVEVIAGRLTMTDQAGITSRSYGAGDAGSVTLRGSIASITDGWIDSDAFGDGDAGSVTVALDRLELERSRITSEAGASGNSGIVDIAVSGALTLRESGIATNTLGSGAAGDVFVRAGSLAMLEGSTISSAADAGASGPSGNIEVETADLQLLEGSRITTSLANANPAGNIFLDAARLLVSGDGSAVSSENLGLEGGPAGNIFILSKGAALREGGRVATNSATGAAGNILFDMTPASYLILSGATLPGVIETSSGPGTGGVIAIASPHAIVIHGGNILALGESGGANVLISTKYFIASADRLNRVEVDGDLQFENAIYDVSAGTVAADLSVIDASGILRGQCPAVRSGGGISQLTVRPTGPYGVSVPAPAGGGALLRPEDCR